MVGLSVDDGVGGREGQVAPEHPGAGTGGQCHHKSRELRVSLQG